MIDTIFNDLYKKLNRAQREAVDAIDGPVVVVAGPGTGKTSILTLRIANILRQTDTPADAILALTFTEAGVKAMRTKLLEIIGPRAYEVRIHTFHSFANDLIKRYPEEFSRIVGAEHMEDLEQVRIIETLINRIRSLLLRPKNSPAYYVLPVIDAIKQLKRENVSPVEFLKLLTRSADTKSDKWKRSREFATLYSAYEKELVKRRLYDFEDMIIEAVRALEQSPNFKLRLQEEHQYVLADEHQDANRSQNRLLELLCDYDPSPNLFIVGDEKQAIFRFQGASLENFLYFKKRFPSARAIALTDNYRSQPLVLSAAHSLMEKFAAGDGNVHQRLAARAGHAPLAIRVVEAQSEASELAWIIGRIEALIKNGVVPREIAVLARENKDAEKVEQALHARGIPAARRGNADALQSVRIDALRKLFVAILNPADDASLAPVLFYDFLKLPLLSVMEAVRVREGGLLILRIVKYGKELAAFQKKLFAWQTIAHNEPLMEGFERIAHESGFLEIALGRPDAPEALAHYAAFLESAKRLAERDKRAKLADFLARLERAEAHGIGIVSSVEAPDGVLVCTAHKAKGLEFDYVFIAFAQDGKWGGKRSRALFELPIYVDDDAENDTHDERRLFYVALTRARKEVSVSWHAKNTDGRAVLPSRFIFEMEEAAREHTRITSLPLAPLGYSPQGEISAIPLGRGCPKGGGCLKERKYMNALFLGQGFAVTHLNNFLECPLKYFFLNLVRVPRAQSGAELYGSAIHTALAAHFAARARDADKPFTEIFRVFENTLRRTHISERDFKVYLAEGKRELKGYLSSRQFSRVSWNEYRVAGIFLTVGKEKLELTGSLDKVEMLQNGSVAVVDYKTGKPRTRNEILGKTKASDGNYYRQLVFYKLLLDEIQVASSATRRSGGKNWNMRTGVIDFIKLDKSGRYHREAFEISDWEVSSLKQQIIEAASQILNLSFLKNGCSKKDCDWCRLCQSI
ncbi:MAG: DNA helicase II / ATP-dependent DNA helicase PcrA [Parcubacteria group bacterium Gr01-1014_17]|nr:MAG: DNA helicase II / ATP-dependent DNA helicase PcrA [Parcubacteria group bacterium Gr01-1014_17]